MINILMSRGILGNQTMVSYANEFIKPKHKVAILLYSFFKAEFKDEEAYHTFYAKGSEYYEKLVNSFLPYGIDESKIAFINYYTDSTEVAIQKIQSADILYFPGGSPDQMMNRIIEKGLKDTIEKHQKIYIGSSAGAMIQFKHYHISPDDDYPRFSYESGLSLLEGFSIEVHYRRRKKQKSALRKVHRAFKQPIFTIPDDGALIVFNDEIIMVETADLMYTQKGVLR